MSSKKSNGIEVIFDPEQFKGLTAKDIIRFIQNHERTAIVGERYGVDKHIIRYRTVADWNRYKEHNPYSQKKDGRKH